MTIAINLLLLLPFAAEPGQATDVTVRAQVKGVIAVVGTDAKSAKRKVRVPYLVVAIQQGEKIPASEQITFSQIGQRYRRWKLGDRVTEPADADRTSSQAMATYLKVAEEEREYRELEVGDVVRAGQVVALIDPTGAIKDVMTKAAQARAAETAALAALRKTLAFRRIHEKLQDKVMRKPGNVSKIELVRARSDVERFTQDQRSDELAAEKARQALLQAIAILDKHDIRSPRNGVVKAILARNGASVSKQDPIIQIAIPAKED